MGGNCCLHLIVREQIHILVWQCHVRYHCHLQRLREGLLGTFFYIATEYSASITLEQRGTQQLLWNRTNPLILAPAPGAPDQGCDPLLPRFFEWAQDGIIIIIILDVLVIYLCSLLVVPSSLVPVFPF